MEIKNTLLNSGSVNTFENNLKSISYDYIKIKTIKSFFQPITTGNKIKIKLNETIP